jgi:hypothetical protein
MEEHNGRKHAFFDDKVDKIIVMVETGNKLSIQYEKTELYRLEDTHPCLFIGEPSTTNGSMRVQGIENR